MLIRFLNLSRAVRGVEANLRKIDSVQFDMDIQPLRKGVPGCEADVLHV
jgi:hypothetical protein